MNDGLEPPEFFESFFKYVVAIQMIALILGFIFLSAVLYLSYTLLA